MKERLFDGIIHHQKTVLGVLVALTLLFGWFAAHVKYDNSLETYFFEDDIKEYDQFLDQFGSDEIIAIAFHADEIFTVENIALIDTISRQVEELPHVNRVLSLTTVQIAYGDKEFAYFETLIEEIPPSPEQLRTIKQRALSDPFIPNIMLSSSAQNTAIVAEVEHIKGEFDYKVELISKVRAIVAEQAERTGIEFHIAGTSIIDDAVFRYNQRDQTVFSPIMIAFMLLVVAVIFRRLTWVGLPILIVVLTIVWTYGFLEILGYKINIISAIISPLLMAVAIADSIHFMTDYLQEAAKGGKTKNEYLRTTFLHIITPCFMTSITTVFGLLSLLSSNLTPIRQFGLVGSGGVAFAFVITVLLSPIILSKIALPKQIVHQRLHRGVTAKMLDWMGTWQTKKAIAILVITVAAFLVMVPQLRQLQIGTNSLDYLRNEDPIRKQLEWVDATIGGSASLEFFLETGRENALKDPALLRQIDEFQQYLQGIDGITGVYAVTDLVKALNRAYNEGAEEYFAIPESSAAIAQYLLLVEGTTDLEELVSDDYARARISARVTWAKSSNVAYDMPDIEEEGRRIFGEDVQIRPTGLIELMHKMESYLLSSQLKSFALAFFVIFIAMVIMLRSFRIGVLAIIPNFMPVVFIIALMPVLNIPLDVGTVMIAGVALGLIVDDTIHFLARFKRELTAAKDTQEAIARALTHTSRPIIYTSVILGFGILVLAFASFKPVVNFGLLLSVVIFLALLFDLLVLPAIIGFFNFKNP